jgi:hypothetical protein
VPDLQRTKESQDRDGGHGDHVDRLDRDDDGALVDPVGGDATDEDEGDEACAQAGRDQRQRRRVIGQFDDLKRHHDGPHALGENRKGYRRDEKAVLADLERCEHAPAAGVGHRLLNFELRAHH